MNKKSFYESKVKLIGLASLTIGIKPSEIT